MQFRINKINYQISGTSHIMDLKPKTLSYLMKKEMLEKVDQKVGAIILVPKGIKKKSKTTLFLEVDNPEALFVSIHNKIYKHLESKKPQTFKRFPNVTFFPPVEIGRKCKIAPNVVIGEDGFKVIKNQRGHLENLIHIGGVDIGNYVEIGVNTAIDKGTFRNTIIKDHVKIDNFVHVAHNCFIDENTAIAPMVCLGGSSRIGKNVWIGMGASIRQGITIGDNAFIAMGSVVIDDVPEDKSVAGNFAVDKEIWKAHHKKLNEEQTEFMKF